MASSSKEPVEAQMGKMQSSGWYVGMECKVQDKDGNWFKGVIKAIKRGRARVVTRNEERSFWVEAQEQHRIIPKNENTGGWVENDYGLKGYQKASTRGELISVAIHNRQLQVSVESTQQTGKVTYYTVRVDTGKHVWEADHRYSEFHELYKTLSTQNFLPADISIPPKTWTFHESSSEVITERTLAFDEFLGKVIRVESIQYCMDLIKFLTIHPEREIGADIKDVNKAFEMGLLSFRQSKLLESRPDLQDLLFPSITSSELVLTLEGSEELQRMRNRSCMEELFKEHESDFVFNNVDFEALEDTTLSTLSGEMVIDFSNTTHDSPKEKKLLMSFSDLSQFDEIENRIDARNIGDSDASSKTRLRAGGHSEASMLSITDDLTVEKSTVPGPPKSAPDALSSPPEHASANAILNPPEKGSSNVIPSPPEKALPSPPQKALPSRPLKASDKVP